MLIALILYRSYYSRFNRVAIYNAASLARGDTQACTFLLRLKLVTTFQKPIKPL